MKATIFTTLSLLLICSPAIAQEVTLEPDVREVTPETVVELPSGTPALPTIFLALPADSYGFAATSNLQASYDNIMAFGQALGAPVPPENQLLALQEMLGEIDLNGSAAAILLDPRIFPKPVALLLSAADAQAVFQAQQAKAGDADEDLPAGVVKFDDDDYVGVKNGFIVYAPQADNVAAVLASQTPMQVMPAAIQAFAKGQIVLAGDLEQAAPFLIQSLDELKAQMTNQMAGGPQMPQTAMTMDMFSLYIECAQSIIQQGDKLAIGLDINAEQAILTKRILFKEDSQAAAFVNAQTGQELPSYAALPGGAFLLAATSNINAEQVNTLMENILNKFVSLPSFEEKFSAEHAARMVSAMKDFYTDSANTAMTFNIGNPMTGLFNMVARYEVPDSAAFMKKTGEMYQAPYMAAWMESFGVPAKYIHTSAAENYSGVDIDTIKMEIAPPEIDENADPQVQQMQMIMMAQHQQMQTMMPMMYGPDMSFRLAAPDDKQVLFVMGGSGRMERAINVAQGNGSVLADDPRIAQAVAKLPASRFAEGHLDLGQVVPMMGMFAAMAGGPPMPPTQTPVTPPVSFSTSAEPNTLRADMVVPSESVGTLVQTFMAMRMQMIGGPSRIEDHAPGDDFKEDDF